MGQAKPGENSRPAYSASEAIAELGIDKAEAPAILGRVIALALDYPWRFCGVMTACPGAALASVFLLGRAVDQAVVVVSQPGGGIDALAPVAWTAALLVLASGLRGILQMTAGYNAEYVGQNVGRDLRLAFFEKLQRLDFAFQDTIHSGDLITRGVLDLEGVRGFLEVGLQRIVQLTMLSVKGA